MVPLSASHGPKETGLSEMWLGIQANYDLHQARKRPPKVRRLAAVNKAA